MLFKQLSQGYQCVAGVDEVGRGPLAGSVVAAAVILDKPIAGLRDSKKLTAKRRELLFPIIKQQSLAWAIASASAQEIDDINILQASLLAMSRAVAKLTPQPDLALIDGNRCPALNCAAKAVIKGDDKIDAIAAASILAKVSRDREMLELGKVYPQYGFERHMGYPTKQHFQALAQYGPIEQHRRSFRPVREALK